MDVRDKRLPEDEAEQRSVPLAGQRLGVGGLDRRAERGECDRGALGYRLPAPARWRRWTLSTARAASVKMQDQERYRTNAADHCQVSARIHCVRFPAA